MFNKKMLREINNVLCAFAKRSKAIEIKKNYYNTIVMVKPIKRSAQVVNEMMDYLNGFEWADIDEFEHNGYRYLTFSTVKTGLVYEIVDDVFVFTDYDEIYQDVPSYEINIWFKLEAE